MAIDLVKLKKDAAKIASILRSEGSTLKSDIRDRMISFIKFAGPLLQQGQQEGAPAAPPAAPPIPPVGSVPDAARLLWVAAGGRPEAFVSLLQTYPDQSLQPLKADPQQLIQVIRTLTQEIPAGEPQQVEGGLVEAWLPSSNINSFNYDKANNRMLVKFNGKDVKNAGGVYSYENVPPEIARVIISGGIPAKTSGSNKWGKWWKGKNPSLGAAVNAMLVKGGFPFKKVG